MGKVLRSRNWRQEKDNGQLELLEGLKLVKAEREGEKLDILLLAQIFVFCCLPYRPTTERQISRKARLGDGSTVEVIFTAMRPGIDIAYGNDRDLLYWLVDKAIQEGTAYISWESATEYLKVAGMAESGRNRQLLRERFRRVSATAITVVRTAAGTDAEDQSIMPIIKNMSLPASISGKSKTEEVLARSGARPEFGLRFADDFVKDFLAHSVPVLRSLLNATRARPQMQDCMFFLIWRSYAAAKESLIPWDRLRDQFWQADSNQARIRLRFKEAIEFIRSAWPEIQAEACFGGLLIAPPKYGVQFIPQLAGPKHIKEAEAKEEAARRKREAEEMLKNMAGNNRRPRNDGGLTRLGNW